MDLFNGLQRVGKDRAITKMIGVWFAVIRLMGDKSFTVVIVAVSDIHGQTRTYSRTNPDIDRL